MASWTTIESDPGVFTELIGKIGFKDVEVSEVWDMSVLDNLKPVYGLIFLFKWRAESASEEKSAGAGGSGGSGSGASATAADDDDQVVFAQQVITNACATQAILNVLFNRPEIEVTEELANFKGFAASLPPDMMGLALSNSESIRSAHNSFARPEPFVMEEKATSGDDDDVFHFVGYVPVGGSLYELDGLKSGPVNVGKVSDKAIQDSSWVQTAKDVIQKRMQSYSAQEVRFNLLALVRNRKVVAEEELKNVRETIKEMQDSGSGDDLTGPLEQTANELQQDIQQHEARYAQWKVANVRRKHNYVPFVYKLLTVLAKKGKLEELKEKGAEDVKKQLEAARKRKAAAAASSKK